jgi:hypothetical protein
MCDDHGHVDVSPVEAIPTAAGWTGEVVPLEPVDEVSVLTVCDNAVDMLLVDHGPAKRLGLGRALGEGAVPMLAGATLREGKAIDAPLAEHGCSALVEIRDRGMHHRCLARRPSRSVHSAGGPVMSAGVDWDESQRAGVGFPLRHARLPHAAAPGR